MTITELNKRMKAANKESLKTEAAQENSQHLADLNRIQMKQGKTTKDTPISPSYRSPNYAAFKISEGSLAPFGTPNLLLTGAFHDGIDFVAESGQYYPTSWDEKTLELLAKYDNILGLSEESKQIATVRVTRSFVNLWKKKVGLS